MSFERVLVGVDGSAEGLIALRQGETLCAENGSVHLVAVAETHLAAHAGLSAPQFAAKIRAHATASLDAAKAQSSAPTVDATLLRGRPTEVLIDLAHREAVSLLAVGSHGMGRAAGMLFASVASAVLHYASCSVLIARGSGEPAGFPLAITVGSDGSESSKRAVAVAEEIAEHTGASLSRVVARGGKTATDDPFRADQEHVEDPRPPIEALTDASQHSDLVIIGSRGLRGLKSLGSVSERVAHQAASSVLVVRT